MQDSFHFCRIWFIRLLVITFLAITKYLYKGSNTESSWNKSNFNSGDCSLNYTTTKVFVAAFFTICPRQNQPYCAGTQSEIYEPNKSLTVIIIDFDFCHRLMEELFLYTKICFVASRTLYLLSYGSKSALKLHWLSMIWSCYHSCR